jgi:hypothetical protein
MRVLDSPSPTKRARRVAGMAAVFAVAVLAVGGFIAGRATGAHGATQSIMDVDGVPVGVRHSPAGALAAADSYLGSEQQTVERDPVRFAALVREAYAPGLRDAALRAARDDRLRDPSGLALWARGGQSFVVIGAHHLDYYHGGMAEVRTWAGQVFWGPGTSPAQTWALGRTTLVWIRDRWRVSAMDTLPSPGPAPAETPQAGSRDDTTAVFDGLLRGFTAVRYGTADG